MSSSWPLEFVYILQKEEAKEKLKSFPKRQTEIALYPKFIDSPEYHPIGKKIVYIYILPWKDNPSLPIHADG